MILHHFTMDGLNRKSASEPGENPLTVLAKKYLWFESTEMVHLEEEFMDAVSKFNASIETQNLELLKESMKIIGEDIWCVDNPCVSDVFSASFVFRVMEIAMDSGDDQVLSYGMIVLCRMMIVSTDIQKLFYERYGFQPMVKLTSHEDRNVSLQALRIVRVLLEYVFDNKMEFKLDFLLTHLQSCVFGSASHEDEIAHILLMLATHVPIDELFDRETYTSPEYPSTFIDLLCQVSVERIDYVDVHILDVILKTTTALLTKEPELYPVVRHHYLPELFERIRECQSRQNQRLKESIMEMVEMVIESSKPQYVVDMIRYLSCESIEFYFNGALDWNYEPASGCIRVLSYLVMVGQQNCISLLKQRDAVQRFSEIFLHNGPFFAWRVFFEFCYAVAQTHDPELLEQIIMSDFDERLMDALETDTPDVVGYALMALWELLNTQSVDIIESYRGMEGLQEKLEVVEAEAGGVTFCLMNPGDHKDVVVSELAAQILAKLRETPEDVGTP